jgi:hypothetical protein
VPAPLVAPVVLLLLQTSEWGLDRITEHTRGHPRHSSNRNTFNEMTTLPHTKNPSFSSFLVSRNPLSRKSPYTLESFENKLRVDSGTKNKSGQETQARPLPYKKMVGPNNRYQNIGLYKFIAISSRACMLFISI